MTRGQGSPLRRPRINRRTVRPISRLPISQLRANLCRISVRPLRRKRIVRRLRSQAIARRRQRSRTVRRQRSSRTTVQLNRTTRPSPIVLRQIVPLRHRRGMIVRRSRSRRITVRLRHRRITVPRPLVRSRNRPSPRRGRKRLRLHRQSRRPLLHVSNRSRRPSRKSRKRKRTKRKSRPARSGKFCKKLEMKAGIPEFRDALSYEGPPPSPVQRAEPAAAIICKWSNNVTIVW